MSRFQPTLRIALMLVLALSGPALMGPPKPPKPAPTVHNQNVKQLKPKPPPAPPKSAVPPKKAVPKPQAPERPIVKVVRNVQEPKKRDTAKERPKEEPKLAKD